MNKNFTRNEERYRLITVSVKITQACNTEGERKIEGNDEKLRTIDCFEMLETLQAVSFQAVISNTRYFSM